MKRLALIFFCITLAASAPAQKEAYDVVSYSLPKNGPGKNWKKETTETFTSYTAVDEKTKSWCRIGIIKSTVSKGSLEKDFENEWQELIVKNYNPTGGPQSDEVEENNGWKIKAGTAKFTFSNNEAIAMLTTASGFERCVSIVITTNSQDYLKDIEALLASVELQKPKNISANVGDNNKNNSDIIGTWMISQSLTQQSKDLVVKVMGNGYSKKQYTFYNNNTYSFITKLFQSSNKEMLLIKEIGSYEIDGNNISIQPQQNIVETWSKKDSVDRQRRPTAVDQWGKLLSSKEGGLEKTTYRFTKHYFAGIQQWNLVLQADEITQREGPFSNNTTFSKAWYYAPVSANNPAIDLPGGKQLTTEEVKNNTTQQPSNNNTTLVGTWDTHASEKTGYSSNNYMISGYVNRQYTFNANGTYNFYSKTYQMFADKMFLIKEAGTYQISGNNFTILPQKSVIEAWSRQGSNDVWGKKLSTQSMPLEKATYSFKKEYFSEDEWKLFLRADKETKRDGPFNNSERNGWVYIITSSRRPVLKLPNE